MTRTILTLGAALVASLAAACTDDLEASCCGETVGTCPPYTYAIARSATVEPAEIMPGDPTPEAVAHVRVEYDSCRGDAPGNHRILMQARTTGTGLPDAGESERVIELDVLYDDGMTHGDEAARDGVVDVMVPNPFFDAPPSTTMTLRFTPELMSCSGEAFEVPYRTGSMWMPEP